MFVKQSGHVYHVLLMYVYKLDIIQETNDKFSKLFSEDVIHFLLKCGRSIGQTKRHDQKLIMAIARTECCFRNIVLNYANLMVARTEIKFCKISSSLETVN